MASLSKKNHYISYLKWLAVLSIILIHLINWSEIEVTDLSFYLRDILHVWLLYFITLSWSLIVIAYWKYDNLVKPTKRLIKRSLMLLAIYFAYSIIKWAIYDFSKEPFFLQFIEKWKWELVDIFTFQAFTVPITVLILWAQFLLITPIILFINKKYRYKRAIILGLIWFFILINYFVVVPRNTFTEILYWENNVLFSFNLWFLPYLIWLYLWMIWFQKKKKEILIFFSITTIFLLFLQLKDNLPFILDPYMYPLKPYYISVSFLSMFIMVYVLEFLEKHWGNKTYKILTYLRFIWDNTMSIFIIHWIIIDLTRWILPPKWIWLTVWIQIIWYLIYKRKLLCEYEKELVSHMISK